MRLALAEQHPDLRVVEPEGNTFRKGDAERVVRHATLAPVEGTRKVVVADGCQDMEDEAAGYLLKTVEEPPASTVFVLLATEVVPELVTIASRCVRIERVRPCRPRWWPSGSWPRASTPTGPPTAAAAAGGDLDRARTLASRRPAGPAPPGLAGRARPARRHGPPGGRRGGRAAVHDRRGARRRCSSARPPRSPTLDEQIEQYGLRGAGKKDLEARHKREVRRFRTAELRFGLATLAAAYRDALVERGRPPLVVDATTRIDAAAVSLQRYPNETLLLQALMAHLPPLPGP